jgi:hypothetical protein
VESNRYREQLADRDHHRYAGHHPARRAKAVSGRGVDWGPGFGTVEAQLGVPNKAALRKSFCESN